jgi:hypothetical protein
VEISVAFSAHTSPSRTPFGYPIQPQQQQSTYFNPIDDPPVSISDDLPSTTADVTASVSVGASKTTAPPKKHGVPALARTNTMVQRAAADAEAESDAEKEKEKEKGQGTKKKGLQVSTNENLNVLSFPIYDGTTCRSLSMAENQFDSEVVC